MRALTVVPGTARSIGLSDCPEPEADARTVLVGTCAVGICGTDHEIAAGKYGWPPPGRKQLIIGHESVARVLEAPDGSGFSEGDWVASIVRQPDPVPCKHCEVGEWDMCSNGLYLEHGIKELDGFAAERFRIAPDHLVKVDARLASLGVLVEPASVVAKAWEHTERIGARSRFEPRRVLVIGAGPIGLLAALMGVQRGLDVHVLDKMRGGIKPELVRRLGATYHSGEIGATGRNWDIVFECTGAGGLLFRAIEAAAPDGIVCLTGVSSKGHSVWTDPGALNREIVLENNAVFGSVNANRRHYEQATHALREADPSWLARLITRKLPVERWADAFNRAEDDVKVVLTFE